MSGWGVATPAGRPLSVVKDTAGTGLMTERWDNFTAGFGGPLVMNRANTGQGSYTHMTFYLPSSLAGSGHRGRDNWVMVDGHIETRAVKHTWGEWIHRKMRDQRQGILDHHGW